MPATFRRFVRRYPFVFAKSDDEQRFNLCIDEKFSGFNGDGRGERLFADDGKPTAYVENILKFLQEYQAAIPSHRTILQKNSGTRSA